MMAQFCKHEHSFALVQVHNNYFHFHWNERLVQFQHSYRINRKMLSFRKVVGYCIQHIVWIIILSGVTSLLLDCTGVMAQSNSNKNFDKDNEVVTSKYMSDGASDKMIGSASNNDRKRSQLFDNIFSVRFDLFKPIILLTHILTCFRFQSLFYNK